MPNISYCQEYIYLVIRIKAKKEHLDDVLSALYNSIAPTHKEEGCIEYKIIHNNTSVMVIGRWKSQMTLDMHLLMQFHLDLFEKVLPPLCKKISVNTYKEIEPPITSLSVL